MPSETARSKWWSLVSSWDMPLPSLSVAAACALVCVGEVRLLDLIEGDMLTLQSLQTELIVTRHPYWRAWQSRLLGPHLVNRIAVLFDLDFERAYYLATHALLVAANILCLLLVRRLTGSYRSALLYLLAFAGLFIAILDLKWLYAWDFIDLLVMLGFAYAIVRGARLRVFVYLFVIELLNREAAQFIALWIVLTAIDYSAPFSWRRAARQLVSPRAAAGIALGVAGVVWTELIRRKLFISSFDPGIGSDAAHANVGQVFMLGDNLRFLLSPKRTEFLVAIGMIWLLAAVVTRALRVLDRNVGVPLGILLALMVVSLLLFGIINETRIYIPLIPFVVVLDAVTRSPSSAPPLARAGL